MSMTQSPLWSTYRLMKTKLLFTLTISLSNILTWKLNPSTESKPHMTIFDKSALCSFSIRIRFYRIYLTRKFIFAKNLDWHFIGFLNTNQIAKIKSSESQENWEYKILWLFCKYLPSCVLSASLCLHWK